MISALATPAERARERRKLSSAERVAEFRAAAAEVAALNKDAEQQRDFAIAAMCQAQHRRLAVGMRLLELQDRFQGDFDAWLTSYCAEYFCRASAYRWMRKVRDLRAVLKKAEPTLEELKKALIATDLLPEPEGAAAGPSSTPPPLFRLKFEVNGPPPEQWSAEDRRDLLNRGKPFVELYERLRALEKAA